MRKRRKTNVAKLGLLFIIILFLLASASASYSIWYKYLYIGGEIETGTWEQTAWARMNNDPYDFTYPFPGNNWATYIIHQPTETPTTFYLYAAQYYRAGELVVWKNTTHLFIEYDLDEGYNMSESQLHVNTSLEGIPQNNGNPPPGQFDYQETHSLVNEYTYEIPWDPDWDNLELYIAAHAVVFGICL